MCGIVESGLTEIGTETHHVLSYVKYDIVWYINTSCVIMWSSMIFNTGFTGAV